jgi:hypothetical protein
MTKAQYMATIPIVAGQTAANPIEPNPDGAGHHHEEPHVAPPRVVWTVSIASEQKRRLIDLANDNLEEWVPRARWEEMGGENEVRRQVATDIGNGRFEFNVTKITPVFPCDRQPDHPFRQQVAAKLRPDDKPWYRKVFFAPIFEAFPGEDCLSSDCLEHEWKATARVRLVGSHAWQHEGFEIDPHVIFHGDGDRDDPP